MQRENTICDKGLEFRDIVEHRNAYLGFILMEVINGVFKVYKAGFSIIHKRADDAVVSLWHKFIEIFCLEMFCCDTFLSAFLS